MIHSYLKKYSNESSFDLSPDLKKFQIAMMKPWVTMAEKYNGSDKTCEWLKETKTGKYKSFELSFIDAAKFTFDSP